MTVTLFVASVIVFLSFSYKPVTGDVALSNGDKIYGQDFSFEPSCHVADVYVFTPGDLDTYVFKGFCLNNGGKFDRNLTVTVNAGNFSQTFAMNEYQVFISTDVFNTTFESKVHAYFPHEWITYILHLGIRNFSMEMYHEYRNHRVKIFNLTTPFDIIEVEVEGLLTCEQMNLSHDDLSVGTSFLPLPGVDVQRLDFITSNPNETNGFSIGNLRYDAFGNFSIMIEYNYYLCDLLYNSVLISLCGYQNKTMFDVQCVSNPFMEIHSNGALALNWFNYTKSDYDYLQSNSYCTRNFDVENRKYITKPKKNKLNRGYKAKTNNNSKPEVTPKIKCPLVDCDTDCPLQKTFDWYAFSLGALASFFLLFPSIITLVLCRYQSTLKCGKRRLQVFRNNYNDYKILTNL